MQRHVRRRQKSRISSFHPTNWNLRVPIAFKCYLNPERSDAMPSPRQVLRDIHDLGLDPTKPHSLIKASGRLGGPVHEGAVDHTVSGSSVVTHVRHTTEVHPEVVKQHVASDPEPERHVVAGVEAAETTETVTVADDVVVTYEHEHTEHTEKKTKQQKRQDRQDQRDKD